MNFRFGIGAVLLLVASGAGHAACNGAGQSFYFQGETVGRSITLDASSGCQLFYTTAPGETITSVRPLKAPKIGRLSQGGAILVNYIPMEGIRGVDRFAVKVCGTRHGRAGCSTLNYTATVQ